MLEGIIKFIYILSAVTTTLASAIAIYVFIKNREKISSAINLLLNYSHQLTLSEIKEKIERLNDYNAKNPEECDKIINLFHEIIGQIRGNERLKSHFDENLKEIELLVSDKRRLSEPRKRAMISEIRERVRNLKVSNIDELVGEGRE